MHQNLTFPVHPDPISGMHCWHQAVRVTRPDPATSHGDIAVDTARAREVYRQWLRMTRPAGQMSPDGCARPTWLMRPLKPATRHLRDPEGLTVRPLPNRQEDRFRTAELWRALGAALVTPPPGNAPLLEALGLPAQTGAEHTGVFVLSAPPRAAIHLGPEGKLGGEGLDRIRGFWRALGLRPRGRRPPRRPAPALRRAQ